jgi:hypothetical protein
MAAEKVQVAKIQRVRCNQCRRNTDHRLIKQIPGDTGSEPYEDSAIWWETTFDILQCYGCKDVVVRRTYIFSEWGEAEVDYFPPRVSRHPPDWKHQLPVEMLLLLEEIYRSLDANNHSLPMMGTRALLDMLICEKIGDVGGFGQKLKELEKEGYVSSKNREVLEAALDAGNAAAHRGYFANTRTVNTVMDIIENLLHAVYVLHDAAEKLRKSTPPRAARGPKP